MSQSDPPDPTRIGDYDIEGLLGAGGMARVYRAKHSILETHHAIKVLDPEYRANAEARKRFLDEAKIQAKHLDHANIVKVTNIVASAEHAALVMELIEGSSLEAALPALKSQPAEIVRIMLGVLDGVGHAHKAGIIHRDLKPANVLLAKRGNQLVPKVTDFGIAKVTAPDDAKGGKKSTHAAARMGTLSYMSPEQIRRAKDVTARSDIFSLGAMLYEMATGEMAFGGESDYDVMENIVNGRYTPAERRLDKIDPLLASVIGKALATNPADRFASCEEMAAALEGKLEVAKVAAAAAPIVTPEAPKMPPAPKPPVEKTTAPAPRPDQKKSEPVAVAAAATATSAGSSSKGIVIGLVGAAIAAGGVAAFLALRGGDTDKPHPSTGSGSDQVPVVADATPDAAEAQAIASPGSAGARSTPEGSAESIEKPVDPVEAPVDATVTLEDAGVAAIDAAVAVEPPKNPCTGRWNSGEDLTINVTGTATTCAGSFAFTDQSSGSSNKGTCGARFTSCRIAGKTTMVTFACDYSRAGDLSGSFAMTCSGRTATARIQMMGNARDWHLNRR